MIIANWKCNGSVEMMLSWTDDYVKECDDIHTFEWHHHQYILKRLA